ncbi:MAG TPA: winged helix-turn-helix domain-containing protein [Trebonia sp.]|nr:winged helix-turn-helix domain-containing protein [Trebonia sp.]
MTADGEEPFPPDRFPYEEIADRLEKRIRNGEFDETGKLPPESELCARYGHGVGAVAHARRILMRRGLVVVKIGKGVFLARRPADRLSQEVRLISAERPSSGAGAHTI